MRTKLVYVMEKEEIEVLRKAKGIINLLYNAEVEFDNDAVEQDLLNEFGDIEDMIIDDIDLNELDKDDYDDFDDEDDDEDIEDDEPIGWCEYCGCAIYEGDGEYVACDGTIHCSDECLVEYHRENYPDEDDEEEDE